MVRLVMFKKTTYIIIIVLFLTSNSLFGYGTRFGVFFNPTITWLQSDVPDVIPVKNHLGFDFGMSLDYFFAENYAFATGVSMFNTGGTLKYVNGIDKFSLRDKNVEIAPNGEVKYKIQYVKIPVALKFKTHLIGRAVYSANLGFDLMMRASAKASFEDITTKEQYDNIATKEINFFNLGWHIGGAVSYHLGGDAFLYGGLTFLDTFTDLTKPLHDKITSQNLTFRIGIMF